MRHRRAISGIAAVAVTALVLSSCATRAQESAETGADGLKKGPGVSEDTITLGVLSDLSAVFGPLGQTLVQGNELYFAERNADGGICDRQVKLEVRDHAYNVQTAVSQFTEVEPEVVGFVQLLGSPMVAALTPRIARTGALTLPTTWSTDWLGKDAMAVTGTSYPGDIINGIEYLLDQGLIDQGDTLGHVYFEGDFGSNALTGSKYAAEKLGLKVKAVQVEPSATDLTPQVNELRGADVAAILVSAGPRQTASIAGVASASGLDVPILSNGPGFDPALLKTPVGKTLEKSLYVATSYEAFGGKSEAAQRIAAAYAEKYPEGKPTIFVNYGYAAASVLGQALDAACEDGDLTRDGVEKALRSLASVDTGVMPPLDLTDPAKMSSTDSYIHRVDANAKGGLTVAEEPFTSDTAEAFAGN